MNIGSPNKHIDPHGRVLIPRQLMEMLGYEIGTPVRVMQGENGDIIIRRNQTRCDVCGNPIDREKCAEIGNKRLCLNCCRAAVEALTREEREPNGDNTPHS